MVKALSYKPGGSGSIADGVTGIFSAPFKYGNEPSAFTKGEAYLDHIGDLLAGVSNQRFLLALPLVFSPSLQIRPNTRQVSASLYLEGLFKTSGHSG